MMKNKDKSTGNFKIKTARASDEVWALDLLDRLTETAKARYERPLLEAERNERYVSGEQWLQIAGNSLVSLTDEWASVHGGIAVTHNLLSNLELTWTQRIAGSRQSAGAFPTTSSESDKMAAEAAQAFIDNFETMNSTDALVHKVVSAACQHGIAGIKITYDPDADEIRWDKATFFDFFLDWHHDDPSDADWVIFRSYLSKWEAEMELDGAKFKDIELEEEEYRIGNGDSNYGVPAFELWHKPTRRIPDGLYLRVVGGYVVEAMAYPYVFTEDLGSKLVDRAYLPLVAFKVKDVRGIGGAGRTWMSDAIDIQHQINELESTSVQVRRNTQRVKLLLSPDLFAQWQEGTDYVFNANKDSFANYVQPPQYSDKLFQDREKLEKRLYDVAGMNEQLVGAETAKSGTSAKQIAYMQELDNLKHANSAKNLDEMILNAWRLSLKLVKRYYSLPRLLPLTGGDVSETMAFTGASVNGADIRLEPRAGMERYSATKAQNIRDDIKEGFRSPQVEGNTIETGRPESTFVAGMRNVIMEQINMVMQGQQVQPHPEVDPGFGSEEVQRQLRMMRESKQYDQGMLDAIAGLKQMYQQLAEQQQVQQAQRPQEGQGEQQ